MSAPRAEGTRSRPNRRSRPPAGAERAFVLPVHKAAGCTSHDVVALLRRTLGVRRVGHTGTLDPFATGLLLCCVGRATKLTGYLMDLDKTYEGYLRLGVRTASGDRTGRIVAEAPVPDLDPARLRDAAAGLEGEILQTPPMFSALKHQGRRLYELARRGVEVERAPRAVRVDSFEILEGEGRRIRFRVRCGRGTYVRTLVEDFGRRLGTEATVDQLTRTGVGQFAAAQAVRQAEIEVGDREAIAGREISMAEATGHLPAVRLTGDHVRRVRHGSAPPWSAVEMEGAAPAPDRAVRLLGPDGGLVGMARTVAVPGPAGRPGTDALRLELERVL
ncbi:MAG: tRNA pseudouridine(55) synthase TruB [Candidatus Eisenbacteria bacterium]|nr:tRNA pseudouridine(55) synthase TruB [Candidatus Eisenbacteria bacterium]